MEQELPSLLQSYELQGKQPFVSDFSRLLRHAIEKGRSPILYSKKKPGTPWGMKSVEKGVKYHKYKLQKLLTDAGEFTTPILYPYRKLFPNTQINTLKISQNV